MCPSLGPGSGTSRGVRNTFPEVGTPGTARALSSGPQPLGEVDASAPPSPRAPALPSGGRNTPRVWLLVLLCLDLSLFPRLLGKNLDSVLLVASRPNRLSRRSVPRLGLGGALSTLRPGPAPPPSPSLSRPLRLQEAPALPFRTCHPSNLGWTPLRRALPPASLRPLRSCNLEAQLSTSGDFSLLSSPWAKFPERSRGLMAFTSAHGVRTLGASAAAVRGSGCAHGGGCPGATLPGFPPPALPRPRAAATPYTPA